MLLVVWWAWNYTTWVTNELDPESPVVRLLLIALMLASLLMAVAIPDAFGERALLFAGAYVAIQVGRHAFLTFAAADAGTLERERAGRILIWFVAAGVFWLAGALADGAARTVLWLVALAIDYGGAARRSTGCPGRRARRPTAWEVETAHFAERFQLFIIIALGESIVVTGATTSRARARRRAPGRVRARLPRHGGAVVALLQLRRARSPSAGSSSRRGPHDAGARRATPTCTCAWSRGSSSSAVGDELVIAHPRGELPGPRSPRSSPARRSTCSRTRCSACGSPERWAASGSPARRPASPSRRRARSPRDDGAGARGRRTVAVIVAERVAARAGPRAASRRRSSGSRRPPRRATSSRSSRPPSWRSRSGHRTYRATRSRSSTYPRRAPRASRSSGAARSRAGTG